MWLGGSCVSSDILRSVNVNIQATWVWIRRLPIISSLYFTSFITEMKAKIRKSWTWLDVGCLCVDILNHFLSLLLSLRCLSVRVFKDLKDLIGVTFDCYWWWCLLVIEVSRDFAMSRLPYKRAIPTAPPLVLFKAEIYYTENRVWAVKSSTASHDTEMETQCKQTDWERDEETQMGRDRRWDEKVAPTPVFHQARKEKRNPHIHLHSSWYFPACVWHKQFIFP